MFLEFINVEVHGGVMALWNFYWLCPLDIEHCKQPRDFRQLSNLRVMYSC